MVGKIAACGPRVPGHRVYSDPGKHQVTLQIWNILQLITVNVRAKPNLNQDLLQLSLEGTALRYTWPFQIGPGTKLIAHSRTTLTMVIRFSPNKNNQKSVEEQAVSCDYKPFLIQPTCQYFSY